MLPLLLFSLVCTSFVSPFALPFQVRYTNNFTEQAETAELRSSYWITNITIGTPGQVFAVVIDTKSSILWVPDSTCDVPSGVCATDDCTGFDCSTRCPDIKCCTQVPERLAANSTCYGKYQFDKTASSTYTLGGDGFLTNDRFGLGAGYTGNDVVVLGNDVSRAVIVPNVRFGQVNTYPAGLQSAVGVDGVMGLAFPALSTGGMNSVFYDAVGQGVVSKPIFTIWLEDQWETKDNGSHGVIYYGNTDPLHCPTGLSLQWFPLSSASFFQLTMKGFVMNPKDKNPYTYNSNTQTIIDTASPYISVPASALNAIYSKLNISQSTPAPATVPCDTLVEFDFIFPSNNQSVTALNLVVKQADGTCKLAIIKSEPMGADNGKRMELGMPFLRGRCTYFDIKQQRIAFTDAAAHN